MKDPQMIDALRMNTSGDHVRFLDLLNVDHRKEMMQDVRTGLARPHKSIPSKYFYDLRGSRLFERITRTPEYYLTRTELSILERSAREILEFLYDGGDIVELGAGSTGKIKRLLDAACTGRRGGLRYIPVDICGSCIESVIEELPPLYPDLEVLGLRADFTSQLRVPPGGKKLLILFGSTIGNFTDRECTYFLEKIRRTMNPQDRFLIGMDMLKPVKMLEAAYNDSEGATREFNLNMLSHMNRELNADFDLGDFQHLAFFNPDAERIEMHLRAKRAVSARISDLSMAVTFRKSETIQTEICRKFSRERIERIFFETGFCIDKWFTDPRGWFSLVEVKTRQTGDYRFKRCFLPAGSR